MSTFDIGIALGFSLLVFLLGLSFSRSGGDIKSFFAGGGAVPWWISGLSLFMSFFSVGTFVVWGSIAYNSGLVAVVIQATMSVAGFVVGAYIAPRWNRTGALTAAEFITDRLGAGTQKIYTITFLFISLFTAGAFLYPVGKIIEVTTGIPLSSSILALGLVIVVYTAIGGLWAVLVTDVLQFVVLSAAVLIVVPLAFGEVGGISGFLQAAPEGFFALHNDQYTWWFMLAFCFYNMVFIGGNWAYVQRYTSVASPRDARKVGWMFGTLYLVAPLIWMLPPMIYRVMAPDLDSAGSEGAYLMVSQAVVPDGMMGLILGAMVFATASSVSTTLNISAGVFTNDIYGYFNKGVSGIKKMIVAKAATVFFGVLAVCVALMVQSMGGIVEVVLSLAAITGTALYLPPIWALFSRVQTGTTVLAATSVSLAVNVLLKFAGPAWFDLTLSRATEMSVGVLVPVILLLAFEVWLRVFGNNQLEFQRYKQKVSEKPAITAGLEADSATANTHGRNVIAIGVFLIGAIIIGLGIHADRAQILIVTMGAMISMAAFFIAPRPWFKSARISPVTVGKT